MASLGIDIAQYQAGIDLELAKRQGVQFVIVKAAGFNTGSLYVASRYAENVDEVRRAGLHLGHYYVTGRTSGSSARNQADFFVNSLKGYRPGDMLVLDNEKLDSNGYVFSDAEAAAFLGRVGERLPGANLWHYAGAADMRSHGPWKLTAATGARFWVASYGSNSGKRGAEPSTGGTPWHLHQYTSQASIGGLSSVDANWSPLPVADLFKTTNGGASASESEEDMPMSAEDWAKMEERFLAVRTRIEAARDIAEDARTRAENTEGKVDILLRKQGVTDAEFPKPTAPRVF